MARKRGNCKLDNCGGIHYCRGWCRSHYNRWRRHGDPLVGRVINQMAGHGIPLRTFLKILAYDGDECLIWPHARTGVGYGNISVDDKNYNVHRLMCERAHGVPPSEEHQAAHSCTNGKKGCCTPRHLRWATHLENMQDNILHGVVSRGSKMHRKLTPADVIVIRQMAKTRLQREIASEYNVHLTTISHVVLRKSWASVP